MMKHAMIRQAMSIGSARAAALIIGCGVVGAGLIVGCASESPTTQPSSVRDRQDAALKDPFSYGPSAADIKKDAANKKKPEPTLKSDWDRFWNP